MINEELFNLLIKNKVMKEHFVRVSKNNKDAMLKQFKQVDDMLQAIITSSAMRDVFFSMLLEQKRALSTICLLYTSPSPRDRQKSRMPSSA